MSAWGRCPCGGTIKQLSCAPMWQCERCGLGLPQEERLRDYRSMTVEQAFQGKWHSLTDETRQEFN